MTPGTYSEGDSMRPWDTLSDDEKRLFSRRAEVYAAFSEYTDAQVGRIIDYLEESAQLDNTLVIYCADNGASGEGRPLESAGVARAIRDLGDPAVDTNRELFATGAANVLGAVFRSLPAAGGFSQSAVNKGAGARSQVAALVTVGLALLVAFLLGPVLSELPQATLASLVFVAVLGLIDVRALARLFRVSRNEFWIAVATAVIGLTAGLLAAVATGVLLTLVLVLHGLNQPRVRLTQQSSGVATVELLAPLYTANVLATQQTILGLVDGLPGLRVLLLDMSRIEETSVTVLDALTELDAELAARGVELRIAALPDAARQMAERTSWFRGLLRDGRVVPTVEVGVSGDPGRPS